MTASGFDETLDCKRVREMLGDIDQRTLVKLVRTAGLPCVNVGRLYLFSRAAVSAWLRAGGKVAP